MAGAVATAVTTVAGAAIRVSGLAPGFTPIDWLSAWVWQAWPLGAALHLVIGIVILPVSFRLACAGLRIPAGLVCGLCFGVLVWWLCMFIVLPALGASLFGLIIGWPIALAVLFLQLLYGVSLALMMR
tara:strand:+ start:3109 stop:3492 length:384 start_codon:yes stop_codon:yes gene_type:complete